MYSYNFLLRVIPCATLVLILATPNVGEAYEKSIPSPHPYSARAIITDDLDKATETPDEGAASAYPFQAQPHICLASPVAKPIEIDNSELAIVQHFIDCLRLADDSRATTLLSSYPKILDFGYILDGDDEGLSFAHVAAANGNLSTLKYILTLKPELTYQRTQDNETILHQATLHKQLATVKFLCKKFSPLVTEVDYEGNTALHTAASNGIVEIFNYLSTRFPELLLKKDDYGYTPLLAAAYDGQLAIINLVLQNFSSLIGLERNKFGHTVLHCLCGYYSQNIHFEPELPKTINNFCRLYPEALTIKSTKDLIVSYEPGQEFTIKANSTPYQLAQQRRHHGLALIFRLQHEKYRSAITARNLMP
ncbi:ankyrin repeat domain-containing protein [Candidatus Odyssella thessalonicensis]|uniref:ankyrin repeat domain-containing protein n=1 Tax=Candidatus Odyssella thessalonicensis TaxID=84647 RepID=UPI000225A8C4|nr:ankyrin repeat domain-containing protein [Candidatus Odyssella thessalonicensis]